MVNCCQTLGVVNKFNPIVDAQLHKDKNMNQLYIHDLCNLFCSKGPNQLCVIFKRIQSE
jgi:hypothetical protein